MPAIAELLAKRAGVALEALQETADVIEREILEYIPILEKRVVIPCCNNSSPAGLVEAETVDPFQKSGKYALGWVYFSIILLVLVTAIRWYHYWNDKIRVAVHKDKTEEAAREAANAASPDSGYDFSGLSSTMSTKKFFPNDGPLPGQPKEEPQTTSSMSRPFNTLVALFRLVFYRPIRNIRWRKGWRPIVFPSLGVIVVVVAAVAFVCCYTFVPQPLYWQSIRFGSPPVAIRSGMLAVAMIPWIVALSMKANFISILTGIGHERLNVLHRWAAYICLLLSLIHTIPFYITPIWDKGGYAVFKSFFTSQHYYVYGTGAYHSSNAIRFHADICRCCGPGAYDLPLRPLSSTIAAQVLRALRPGARSSFDSSISYALLALPQLPHILELSICDLWDLAGFIYRPLVFLELDEPVAHVLAYRRGSCRDSSARKRGQDYCANTGQVETRPIRLRSNAWHLCFREPSFHHRLVVQRRLSIGIRRGVQRHGLGLQAI